MVTSPHSLSRWRCHPAVLSPHGGQAIRTEEVTDSVLTGRKTRRTLGSDRSAVIVNDLSGPAIEREWAPAAKYDSRRGCGELRSSSAVESATHRPPNRRRDRRPAVDWSSVSIRVSSTAPRPAVRDAREHDLESQQSRRERPANVDDIRAAASAGRNGSQAR